jgi:cellobiose transport system permease protein
MAEDLGTVRRERDNSVAMSRRGRYLSHWREYVAVSPFFVLFLAFAVIPLGYAGYISLRSWDGLGPSTYVGNDQWVRLFTTGEFWKAAANTVVIFLMGQVPVLVGALVAAIVLSRPRLRGRGFYQAAFFLPQVTSLVVVAIVFQAVFGNTYGIIDMFLRMLGLPEIHFMTTAWGARFVIALMIIWRGFGFFLIVFMAGLSAIDSALFEAARLDGASPVQIVRWVTLPALRPTLIFASLTGTIGGLQMFTEPQVLFGGPGPGNGGMTMMLLQYEYLGGPGMSMTTSSVKLDLGWATVVGWAIFVILLVLAVASSRLVKTSNED